MTTTPIRVTAFEIHRAIAIDGVGLDPIRVILHDIKPGEGRLIIECYGDSWSNYWGGMGQYRIMQFVCEADVDYIASRMLNSDGTQAQKAQQEKYLRRIVYAVREAMCERYNQELIDRYKVGSQWVCESSGVITVTAFHPDHWGDNSSVMRLLYTTENNGGGHMGKNHIMVLKPYRQCGELEEFLRSAITACNEQADSFKTANWKSSEAGSRAMATAYQITLDHILASKQMGRECGVELSLGQQLPDKAEFYWWRETESDEWRMLQLVEFGDGHLVSYDMETQEFKGRSMMAWKKHDPPGFWLAIDKPAR